MRQLVDGPFVPVKSTTATAVSTAVAFLAFTRSTARSTTFRLAKASGPATLFVSGAEISGSGSVSSFLTIASSPNPLEAKSRSIIKGFALIVKPPPRTGPVTAIFIQRLSAPGPISIARFLSAIRLRVPVINTASVAVRPMRLASLALTTV